MAEAPNGIKPGFFPWHDDKCEIEFRHESRPHYGQVPLPGKSYWCKTHKQWCTERPVSVTYGWADGSQTRVERPSW
jgi:hypothetical protein